MGNYIFKHLQFARENTISQIAEVNDETSHIIPEGFSNNIKWNLGHIYVVHEMFAFRSHEEKMMIPDHFTEWFSRGTKPGDWGEGVPPIDEFARMLESQVNRIEQLLEPHLNETVGNLFTTSTGSLTLSTVEEFLSFCFYHEGVHIQAIKSIKRMIQQ
ncbi:DinB family protein [Pseudalkalibacillus salsuginis]|uniref:DinB family protein n=1 Tax=Pseudalkalibacillus salsuginis TaxID=2910972 RepID=UPI001F3C5AC4|nr:DinB family protein [Pseudalkalibacillus salsuginis]MCF6410015.1 DinB family protein [Pseudalkalibacillus salsuginis]